MSRSDFLKVLSEDMQALRNLTKKTDPNYDAITTGITEFLEVPIESFYSKQTEEFKPIEREAMVASVKSAGSDLKSLFPTEQQEKAAGIFDKIAHDFAVNLPQLPNLPPLESPNVSPPFARSVDSLSSSSSTSSDNDVPAATPGGKKTLPRYFTFSAQDISKSAENKLGRSGKGEGPLDKDQRPAKR